MILKEKLVIENIANGALNNTEDMSLDVTTMKRYGLTPANTRVIDLDGSLLFVNTEETNPSSGRYYGILMVQFPLIIYSVYPVKS
ncbi:MAG: hypothetical protein HRT97_08260 [Moritella sp.]|uniref:hypothetical protein n=1 Tax=Moritella sp. TaxID=78556 RepID=UPI0025D59699|nr:hypothetical protein [Moritella sp.]NQZ92318.1 hypothetical protein [Moritella sp.]